MTTWSKYDTDDRRIARKISDCSSKYHYHKKILLKLEEEYKTATGYRQLYIAAMIDYRKTFIKRIILDRQELVRSLNGKYTERSKWALENIQHMKEK